ncbi:MAG: protein kinase [Myxococcales bacterium]|nr:protein kinase [Myxococcales bacterium]
MARIGGRYRLQARIGKGDLGVLWAALDERSGQPVAVRILQRGLDDPRRVARFRASALAAARLDHPGIVRVLDEGTDDRGPFIVSAWVDGVPLAAWRGQPMPWGFLQAVMTSLCDALAHVHAAGLVHLDLRPRNILIVRGATGPEVRLVDVGQSRIDDGWSDSSPGAPATLKYLGTLRYLAPEVAESPPWKTGPWSDLYSAGLILWELLTGNIPLEHLNGVALLLERACADAPALPAGVGGALHGTLDALLSRLLARDPLDRPKTAAQVRRTLASLPGEPVWCEPAPMAVVQLPPADPRRIRAAGFPLHALHTGPLIGRDAAVEALWTALQGVVSEGQSRLVVLDGAPATGKSRVVESVARHGAARGVARTWTVRFQPGTAPGTGLLGAVEALLKGASTDRAGLAQRVAALPLLEAVEPEGLGAVVPALLRPDSPGFPRPGAFGEPGAQAGGQDAAASAAALFIELVRRAARNDAMLLWLADAQHAPEDELLGLVRQILEDPGLPVCVVVTGRVGSPNLRALAATHPPGDAVTWRTLGPLDVDAARSWLRERLALSPLAEQRVLAATHGRPALLEGMTAWLLDGHLVPGRDGNEVLPGSVLPESLTELWRHDLARLPAQGPDTLVADVIAGLALARVPLGPTVIAALEADDPERGVARALSAGERARLLVGRPGGSWQFVSPELVVWLGHGFADSAARWHAVWLRTLERLEGRAHGRYGPERAWHAEALGDTNAAIQALLDAASWALSPGQQAWERGLKAAERARILSENLRDPVRAGRAERLRAALLREAGRGAEAREALAALEPRLMIPPARGERAACVLLRALLALDDDRLDEAATRLDEAEKLFAAEGDEAGRLHVVLGQGHLAVRRGLYRIARTCGRDAEEGFKARGDTGARLSARILRACAAAGAGDHATAEQRFASLMDLADQRGWLLEGVRLRLRRVPLALAQGRAHDALALVDEVQRRAELLGLADALAWVAAVRPGVLAAAGQAAAARGALEQARLPTVLAGEAAAALAAALQLPTNALDAALHGRLTQWLERVREVARPLA